MAKSKVLAFVFFILIIATINLLAYDLDILSRLIAISVCVYGYHLVYAFVFNTKMYVTGLVVEVGASLAIRIFFLFGGIIALTTGVAGFFVAQ